jgi:hypothetical protein
MQIITHKGCLILLFFMTAFSSTGFGYSGERGYRSRNFSGISAAPIRPQYRETEDTFWRAPRIPVYASDGTVRYVSRAYMYNTRHMRDVPPRYGYVEHEMPHERSRGLLTRILEKII